MKHGQMSFIEETGRFQIKKHKYNYFSDLFSRLTVAQFAQTSVFQAATLTTTSPKPISPMTTPNAQKFLRKCITKQIHSRQTP
jgi:hypothetical protein